MNGSAGDFDELPCQAAADLSSHLTLQGIFAGPIDGSFVSHYSCGTSRASRRVGNRRRFSSGPRRLLAAWSDLSRLLMRKGRLFPRNHSAQPRLLNGDLHRSDGAFATGC